MLPNVRCLSIVKGILLILSLLCICCNNNKSNKIISEKSIVDSLVSKEANIFFEDFEFWFNRQFELSYEEPESKYYSYCINRIETNFRISDQYKKRIRKFVETQKDTFGLNLSALLFMNENCAQIDFIDSKNPTFKYKDSTHAAIETFAKTGGQEESIISKLVLFIAKHDKQWQLDSVEFPTPLHAISSQYLGDRITEDLKLKVQNFATWYETENNYFKDEMNSIKNNRDLATSDYQKYMKVKDSIILKAMKSIDECELLDRKLKKDLKRSDEVLKYNLATILTGNPSFFSLSGFDLSSIKIEKIKTEFHVIASINGNLDGPEREGIEKIFLYMHRNEDNYWVISRIEIE